MVLDDVQQESFLEDTSPTSRKEILGWYSYAFASEVVSVVTISNLAPVALENFARENGYALSELGRRCEKQDDRCIVYLGYFGIDTASFALYVFSIGVLLQALIVVSIGNLRKKLLGAFAYTGSLATMLFVFVPRTWFILAGFLIIILNICFGSSTVCLNALLPVLVRNYSFNSEDLFHSKSTNLYSLQLQSRELLSHNPESANLITQKQLDLSDSHIAQLELSSHISSQGVAIGLVSGVILQLICIPLVVSTGSNTRSLQYAIFVSGVWWFIFTIPSMRFLKNRPGPELPTLYKGEKLIIQYIQHGWKNLFEIIKEASHIVLFLVSWALLSDAYTTISSSAILFAKTDLHIKPAGLIVIGILSTLSGIIGAFTWNRYISPALHLSPESAILLTIALSCLIPVYGLLGFIPFCRQIGFGGLVNPIEIYILALVYGFLNGGIQGYCRAVFGSLIPPGHEAGFFALYAITDKGSSIIGPAIVGIIIDKTHEIRWAFLFLAVMLVLSLLVMMSVNTQRGLQMARY